jgi:hypothetical protein
MCGVGSLFLPTLSKDQDRGHGGAPEKQLALGKQMPGPIMTNDLPEGCGEGRS